MPVVRCRGCDSLGDSYAFFCDVECQRRTPCPHIGGVVDLSKPCSCACCTANWYLADLQEEKQELEEKQGNALFRPFEEDFDCTAEVAEFWDATFGKFKGHAKRNAYKEAMVRIQAGKQRKVDWAVGDVVEGMILVVEGRTWRPDWLLVEPPDVSECRRCRRCRSSVGVVSERCRLTLVSTVSEVSGLCLTGV